MHPLHSKAGNREDCCSHHRWPAEGDEVVQALGLTHLQFPVKAEGDAVEKCAPGQTWEGKFGG